MNTVFCLSVFPQAAATAATMGSEQWGEAVNTNQ